MTTFVYILLALVILLVMVIIHEFGHYLAGKILKFKINEFSVGFGPKLFSKTKKNGEVFSLRLVPLGGFCAFEGEAECSEDPSVRSFVDEKPWKRIIVLLAGGIFNLISAIVFSFLFILIVGYATPKITQVYYADEAWTRPYCYLAEGDEIVKVNGKKINVMHTFEDYTSGLKSGDQAVFAVKRDGEIVEVSSVVQSVTLKTYKQTATQTVVCGKCGTENTVTVHEGEQARQFHCDDCGNALVFSFDVAENTYDGFGFQSTRVYSGKNVGSAFLYCIPFTGKMAWTIIGSFFDLITGKVAITALTGPVGTVTMMASVSQSNWRNIFVLLPLLAANLGIFNLLPIPALDGSKVVFTVIEWIRGKPINRKVENYIHTIGLLVLLAFVLVIDIVGMVLRF